MGSRLFITLPCLLFAVAYLTSLTTAYDDIPCELFIKVNKGFFPCKTLKIITDDNERIVDRKRQCIVEEWECDSIIDCQDGSDESEECTDQWKEQCTADYDGKTTKDGNPLQKFQCDNKMCIPGCQQCDGFWDCVDGSDEENCPVPENFVRPPCN